MKIRENIDGIELILSLEGTFDETSSPIIEKQIQQALTQEEINTVNLDMKGVKHISSAGICVLIAAHKKALKTGKRVTVGPMSSKVKEVLEVVHIMPLFTKEKV